MRDDRHAALSNVNWSSCAHAQQRRAPELPPRDYFNLNLLRSTPGRPSMKGGSEGRPRPEALTVCHLSCRKHPFQGVSK